MELTSRDAVRVVQIIQNGQIVREIPGAEWAGPSSLGRLTFAESGWFLVRVLADVPHTFRFASTGPFFVQIDQQPRISRQSVQFFLDWATERRARVQLEEGAQRDQVLGYHDAALEFWGRQVDRGNAP